MRLGLVWLQKLSCRSKGKTQGNDSLSQRPQHWSDSWPTGRLPVTMEVGTQRPDSLPWTLSTAWGCWYQTLLLFSL